MSINVFLQKFQEEAVSSFSALTEFFGASTTKLAKDAPMISMDDVESMSLEQEIRHSGTVNFTYDEQVYNKFCL